MTDATQVGTQAAFSICKEKVVADYVRNTLRSRQLFERASRVLPGGVSGNLRYFAPYPLYMQSGEGSHMMDVDGRRYLDCFSCNGPLLLGHRHPAILSAQQALTDAGSLVLNPQLMIECAEKLQQLIPCAERVRFLNSGTEAVMSATRYARAYTGKDKIIKFYGHYHGQDDQFLLGVAPDRSTFGSGIPRESIANTLTLPCNDEAQFRRLIASRDDVAAVLIDPAMHSGGLWGATRAFLELLREETAARRVVLIFDEVITGFRMGTGGAQAYHGVTPDLCTLAKALGAGEKLAVVAGVEEIMKVSDPLAAAGVPRVFQSGTGNDGTLALAAALAAMTEYERLEQGGEYEALWRRVEELEATIRSVFASHGIDVHVNRLCSMMQLFLTDRAPGFEAFHGIDSSLLDLVYLALINEGVMLSLPTSNHIYFSFAHTQADFDEIGAALDRVLRKYPFQIAYQQLTGRR